MSELSTQTVKLEEPDFLDSQNHPLYSVLVYSNTFLTPDRDITFPVHHRRIPMQIAVLEILKRQGLTKEQLLPFFDNLQGKLWRYLGPLIQAGLIQRERLSDGTIRFSLSDGYRIQFILSEQTKKLNQWVELVKSEVRKTLQGSNELESE